jgi:hypothetical protein
MQNKDFSTYWWTMNTLNMLILIGVCTLWGFTSVNYPGLDGVSVYQLMPTLPKQDKFLNGEGTSIADDIFLAKAGMVEYCVFPDVFNQLTKQKNVETYLISRGMGADTANTVEALWGQINFNATRTDGTEYNMPYDDLKSQNKYYPDMSSQYYPPVCRCMNKVFKMYSTKKKGDKDVYLNAKQALGKCMLTQHIIKRQTLIGSTDGNNRELMNRKYISRHAMLFQLCAAFLLGSLYKMIDTTYPPEKRIKHYVIGIAMFFVFLAIWFANLLSTRSVHPIAGITWGSIIFPAGTAMGVIVELMWSYSAKKVDLHRITFMHPLVFYYILSALFTIASIENGVFTLSVLVTQVFQANVLTMAYTVVLFVTHGKIWKGSTSARTGFFLVLLLTGMMNFHHMTPFFPVNTGRAAYLWLLPLLFTIISYSKILFIDHFIAEDEPLKEKEFNGKRKTSHSEHLFDILYLLMLGMVISHFVMCINELIYGDPNAISANYNAGRLTKRLNFAFGEVNVLSAADKPFYSTLATNNQNDFMNRYYINP